jgi:uncharacterized membrane protein SpoIIM required for sporulation
MSRALFEARLDEAERAVSEDLAVLERQRRVGDPLAFVAHHRELAATLSLARHRRYDQALVSRLNALVVRAHATIHRARAGRALRTGLATVLFEFPRQVRALPLSLFVSVLCFAGSYLGVYLWITLDPHAAYAVLPADHLENMSRMYDPNGPVQSEERDVATSLAMFGFYVWNNVGIAFRTFGSGLLLGVGSIFVLLFNGVVIGASHAFVVNEGFADSFHSFVVGHSGFELVAIVLSGLAGLHVGLAVLAPGLRSRKDAVLHRAREARPILWGSFVMLVVAAAIEAFFSPHELPLWLKLTVGGANVALLSVFFTFAGRSRAAR